MKLQKIAISGDAAATTLLEGLDILARTVGTTFGPAGKVVVLDMPWQAPVATRDGATVTKAVELDDPIQSLGAQLLRHAALRTADVAGDGTTTAVLIGHGLVKEAWRAITAGAQRSVLAEELTEALTAALASLENQRLEPTPERIRRVAVLAARDDQIGRTVVDACERAGATGTVTVSTEHHRSTRMRVESGHRFHTAGYHTHLGHTDPDASATWENATLLVGERFENVATLRAYLDDTGSGPVALIGRINEPVRDLLSRYRAAGRPVVAMFPPGKGLGHGDNLRAFCQDLALLTGGAAYLGHALTAGRGDLTFDHTSVTVTNGRGDPGAVAQLRSELRAQIDTETSTHARSVIRQRLDFLARPLVRIEVGAATTPEAEELRHRYDDAVGAVQSALREGVLPGGGAALRTAAGALPRTTGGHVLGRALQYPIARLLRNANTDPGPVLTVLDESPAGTTWDLIGQRAALADEIGVFDSAAAIRCALVHAADVAHSLVLTDTVLAEAAVFWR